MGACITNVFPDCIIYLLHIHTVYYSFPAYSCCLTLIVFWVWHNWQNGIYKGGNYCLLLRKDINKISSNALNKTSLYVHWILMPLESFDLLPSFSSEYDCWEIIMFGIEGFLLNSAACFILAAIPRALKPQAYSSTHRSHSTFAFLSAPHFRPPFFPAPFSIVRHKLLFTSWNTSDTFHSQNKGT